MSVREKSILAAIFILFVGMLIYSFFNPRGVITLIRKKQDMHYIEKTNEEIRAENARLRQQINLIKNNSDYIDVLIRDNLEMIGENEILIKFVSYRKGSAKK